MDTNPYCQLANLIPSWYSGSAHRGNERLAVALGEACSGLTRFPTAGELYTRIARVYLELKALECTLQGALDRMEGVEPSHYAAAAEEIAARVQMFSLAASTKASVMKAVQTWCDGVEGVDGKVSHPDFMEYLKDRLMDLNEVWREVLPRVRSFRFPDGSLVEGFESLLDRFRADSTCFVLEELEDQLGFETELPFEARNGRSPTMIFAGGVLQKCLLHPSMLTMEAFCRVAVDMMKWNPREAPERVWRGTVMIGSGVALSGGGFLPATCLFYPLATEPPSTMVIVVLGEKLADKANTEQGFVWVRACDASTMEAGLLASGFIRGGARVPPPDPDGPLAARHNPFQRQVEALDWHLAVRAEFARLLAIVQSP